MKGSAFGGKGGNCGIAENVGIGEARVGAVDEGVEDAVELMEFVFEEEASVSMERLALGWKRGFCE